MASTFPSRTGLGWLALSVVIAQASPALAAARAFPEAEGFGALATGGRGNKVVHVTNLSDSGAGSLRDAMSQGNRIVVFDVGGVITLASKLAAGGDNLTIAGQTAPGDGITVYGNGTSFSSRKNIVVRFVRFHQGLAKDSAEGTKAVNLTDVQNMIFDHVSVQWGRWDCFGITGDSAIVTVQDSIIGEAIVPQKFGALVDSADQVTIARTLWIDNESRNPKFKANGQYINNVVYNWGGGGGLIGGHSSADWYEDLINNYFIAGPANTGSVLSQYAGTDRVFHQGNLVDVDRNGKLSGRAVANGDFQGDSPPTFEAAAHNRPSVPVTVLSPEAAYERILVQAGVCAKRDAVDQRLINQLRSLGTSGAIVAGDDGEAGVGGQPAVAQSQRPAGFDTDGDGMPDAWETAHGLDPSNAADATTDGTGDGYTNVEKYLNELASSACGEVPPPPDAGADGPRDVATPKDGVRLDAVDSASRDADVTGGSGGTTSTGSGGTGGTSASGSGGMTSGGTGGRASGGAGGASATGGNSTNGTGGASSGGAGGRGAGGATGTGGSGGSPPSTASGGAAGGTPASGGSSGRGGATAATGGSGSGGSATGAGGSSSVGVGGSAGGPGSSAKNGCSCALSGGRAAAPALAWLLFGGGLAGLERRCRRRNRAEPSEAVGATLV